MEPGLKFLADDEVELRAACAHAVDLLLEGRGGLAVGIHNEELVESPILGTKEEGALFSLAEDGSIIVNMPHKARLDFAELNRDIAHI